ncbi:hypothetical protein [Enterobacter ludwigii]|uniref:hypothetical protein n=1 Tax=Enterobacter ludwigii TaxID=299767 RepID=UPI002A82C996|nr:hypothetical protein [Enterobacter ludwigii]
MDESRKAFEKYAADRLGLPLEMISDARNGDRYMHAFDSMNVMQPLNGWWTLWQASRAAIEVKLPEVVITGFENIDSKLLASYMGLNRIKESIRAAGIKVKE